MDSCHDENKLILSLRCCGRLKWELRLLVAPVDHHPRDPSWWTALPHLTRERHREVTSLVPFSGMKHFGEVAGYGYPGAVPSDRMCHLFYSNTLVPCALSKMSFAQVFLARNAKSVVGGQSPESEGEWGPWASCLTKRVTKCPLLPKTFKKLPEYLLLHLLYEAECFTPRSSSVKKWIKITWPLVDMQPLQPLLSQLETGH